MLFFLSIRSLSFLLICLLVSNIASLLAAPFYYFPARSELKRATTQTRVTTNAMTATTDQTDRLSLPRIMHDNSPSGEDTSEPSGPGWSELLTDPSESSLANIPKPNRPLWLESTFDFESSSKRVLNTVGRGLAKNPVRLPQRIANVAKYLTPDEMPTITALAEEAPTKPLETAVPTLPNANSSGDDPSWDQISLFNPASNSLEVAFLLDEKVHTLTPGSELIEKRSDLTIRFDRGGGQGLFRKRLPAGKYRFTVSASGWILEPMQAVD